LEGPAIRNAFINIKEGIEQVCFLSVCFTSTDAATATTTAAAAAAAAAAAVPAPHMAPASLAAVPNVSLVEVTSAAESIDESLVPVQVGARCRQWHSHVDCAIFMPILQR
jgi:hypothetical protein